MDYEGRSVLVTGGTGSFGKAFVSHLLKTKCSRIVVFSRDESKHRKMISEMQDSRLRFFLGDVRDLPRLRRAVRGVDYVVHAAAQKDVPLSEYNPTEAIKTNVIGSLNLIEAALDSDVRQVVALSTDKAVSPDTLYGATKMCVESIFRSANSYSGSKPLRFACVRYGNVAGSEGSVLQRFREAGSRGENLRLTGASHTRFWMRMSEAIDLVDVAFQAMTGGEVFVKKAPSVRIRELAEVFANHYSVAVEECPARCEEKQHEVLVRPLEVHRAKQWTLCHNGQNTDYITIEPPEEFRTWYPPPFDLGVYMDSEYTSDNNTEWVKGEDLLTWDIADSQKD